MVRALRKLCLIGAPLLALACTGAIGDGKGGNPGQPGNGSNPPGGNGNGNGMTPGGGNGNGNGNGMIPGTNEPAPTGDPPSSIAGPKTCTSGKPGPRLLRRLTEEQLDNSVRDLFRNPAAPKSNLFNDPQVLGFTGDAGSLLVRDLGSQQLMSYAEQVGRWAVTTPAVVMGIAPCNQMTADCRSQFIRQFGQRAFRQPLTDAMVSRYEALFAAGGTFEKGLETTITAMLQSPYFLYRRELGEPDPQKPGQVRLTQFEVASALSYLITRTMPDDQLLKAAADNQLGTRAQIDAQVERLLQNPENRKTMHTFIGEWLESKNVATVLKEPKVFDFTEALRTDMERETAALIDDVVFTRNGTLADLFNTNYTFVNANLAKHYGLPAGTVAQMGDQLAKVTTQRDTGILAQGSILSAAGSVAFSSPTLRGKLVRTRLLCENLPPPPDNVDTNIKVPEGATLTTREIFETHSENATCRPCHNTMDPIGYGFENYDLVGRYRTMDNGKPIDASGEIIGTGFKFNGLKELNQHLANNATVRQCLVRYMAYYAYGATGWADDGCTTDAISTEAEAANWSIRSVLTAITHAPHFTTRVQ